MTRWTTWIALAIPLVIAAPDRDDKRVVAALDTQFQAAVRRHDSLTINRIVADDYVLVTGRGNVYSKRDLLNEARDTAVVYEHQEDTNQTVRLWGDVAVVTALLWQKGTDHGKPFDYKLWFSDTYLRTPQGWRYVFAQSSVPLPAPD